MDNKKEEFLVRRQDASVAAGYLFLVGLGIFTVICVGMSIIYGGDPGGIIGVLGVVAIIIGIRGWKKSLREKIQSDKKYFESLSKKE